MKKYRLIRNFIAAGYLTATISVALTDYFKMPLNINYTPKETIENETFQEELTEIKIEEHIWENQELYSIIKQTMKKNNLTSPKQITELEIPNTLTNNDLSELKYLYNLRYLIISNNTINIEDIKYNQELDICILDHCNISNINNLPNSISRLYIFTSKIEDKYFKTPYLLKELSIFSTPINNLTIKNPSYLEILEIKGDTIIDFNCLKECNNLEKITLQRINNITNSEILTQLPNLKEITLDDYCPSWLTTKEIEMLYSKITNEDKTYFLEESYKIDSILEQIIPDKTITDEQKIKLIVKYILNKYEYDNEILISEIKSSTYNEYPLRTIFSDNKAVCINYATLFNTFLRRSNIECYQLFNEDHTWNMICNEQESYNIDLTNLDTSTILKFNEELYNITDMTSEQIIEQDLEDKLLFYKFQIEELTELMFKEPIQTPQKEINIPEDIGYVNQSKKIDKLNKDLSLSKRILLISTILFMYLSLTEKYIKNKEKNILKYKKDNE